MKEVIERLQLTRLGRLLRTWQAVCILTVVLCWVLFGWFKALLLCVFSGLSYCSAAYLYYNTEARQWREQVDQWYQELFIWALGYEHPPSSASSMQAAADSYLQHPASSDTGAQNRGSSSGKIKPQPSKMCHREAQKMIQLIMQHFVHQWYNGITNDAEFPEDVQKILEHVALEINIRLKGIELEEIVCEIAALVIPYLEAVNKAGERDLNGIKVFDVTHENCVQEFENNIDVEHRSLRSHEQELRYYRQALDTLIQCAVPNEYAVCDPACMFVREILLANIIEPLLNLLCDPDFLYNSIPVVLSKASKEKVERELAEIQHENEKLEKQLSRGRLMVRMQGQQRVRFHSFTNRFGHSFAEGSPGGLYHSPQAHPPSHSPPTYSRASPRHTRPVSTLGIPSTASTRDSSRDNWRLSMQDLPHRGSHGMAKNYPYELQAHNPTQSMPLPVPSQAVQQSENTPQVQIAHSLPPQYTVQGIHLQEDYYDDVGSEEVESAPCEPDMVYVELPSIYIERHVRVVSGPSSHIAYVFKFPKRMLKESELNDLKVSESDTHLEGMKRYSEFLSLHNTLLKSSSYAQHVKGLELPDRGRVSSLVSKLPFASFDPDPAFLLERKQGLEKYLQSISSVSEIAESDCFHKFLTSGVLLLKSAHHVVPNPQKAVKRRSFLGIVKAPVAENVLKAEPIPKRPIEAVLSGYLNTHLPLPCCSFHSIHSIHTKRQKLSYHHQQQLDVPQPFSSYSLFSRAQSRMFGSPASELNLANASPTQSFDSTISTADGNVEIPTVTGSDIGATPPTTVGESSLQTTVTSAETTAPDFSNSSGETTQATGIANDDTIGGSDEQLLTGTSQRTKAPDFSDGETETSSSSVRLRGKSVRKSSQEKTPIKSALVTSDDKFIALKMKVKRWISLAMMYIAHLASLVSYIVRRGLDPITQHSTLTIVKEQEKRVPLTNALFSMGTEASSKHCPELWACSEDIQLALLVMVGGASERYLWKELKEVVYAEENWARALYHLRHTLWPGGEVMKGSKRTLSEKERLKVKQEAAEAIKKFLPNFLPYVVGTEDYNAAAIHCLNCLANPRINRHFILRIVEVFLMRLVPEINSNNFKARLERLRTLKMANNKTSLSSLSAFHRRTLPRSDTM